MHEVSVSNKHVTLVVEADPQADTFAFNWYARVNGTSINVSKQDLCNYLN